MLRKTQNQIRAPLQPGEIGTVLRADPWCKDQTYHYIKDNPMPFKVRAPKLPFGWFDSQKNPPKKSDYYSFATSQIKVIPGRYYHKGGIGFIFEAQDEPPGEVFWYYRGEKENVLVGSIPHCRQPSAARVTTECYENEISKSWTS